jgi:endonuclease III
MKNEQIFKNDELIPLLIKYVKVNKVIFPIERVKYLSNEEVVEVLKDCINNQIIYNPNYEMIKNITLLDDNDLKDIYPLIKASMDNINYDYMRDIKDLVNDVKLRKKGKKYSFEEHLKALIIALLSNHRWGDNNIRENTNTINNIFHNYDKNYLKIVNPSILVKELKKIHCTNPMINNQMKALSKNIMVLEKIEKDYGSLDKFVNKETPNDIANMFNSGKYKLTQVGRAFAYDYLKRVGVNTCKKSSQLERLFGSHRLGIVKNTNATEQQVLNIIKKIAILNNCDEIIVESIIQQFCLLRSANICGEHPNCERCKIREYCNYNKKYDDICPKI